MNGEHLMEVNDENAAPDQVIRETRQRVNEILNESRIARQVKMEIENEMNRANREVEKIFDELQSSPKLSTSLVGVMVETLTRRGIETEAEWKDYVRTIERDGEVVSELCEALNTDTLQLKDAVAKLQQQARADSGEGHQPLFDWKDVARGLEALFEVNVGDASSPRGCRKYEKVITCEATLIDILGDDHLGGRAKSIFTALPRFVKEQGFEAVTREMAKLLSSDTVAGRMRALTELRNLRIRPNQEVADFCTILEKLGRQANPECTISDRSMEYAQILLDNLSHWPEHFQLLGALHKVEPGRAYEEVKQLALSIEQSRLMLSVQRKPTMPTWKQRASHYFEKGRADKTEEESKRDVVDPIRVEPLRQTLDPHHSRARVMGNESNRRNNSVGQVQGRDENNSSRSTENRKCYNCAKYGHIGRDCPKRATRVNQIECDQSVPTKTTTLSSIIRQVRSVGLLVKAKTYDDLVGSRVVMPFRALGEEIPALIDTGSMISIVPIEVLARAQDRGIDVDALRFMDRSLLKPVYDASNNEMKFLGAVYIEVELVGGNRSTVAFYISSGEEKELLIGTNALRSLGVNVITKSESDSEGSILSGGPGCEVAVVRRAFIPPHDATLVEVQCKGEMENEVDRVIWPSKAGVASGVFKVLRQQTRVPVFNDSDEPMILKQGENVGHWGTDKWHESWKEFDQLRWESEETVPSKGRMDKLCGLIAKNSESEALDSEIRELLYQYPESFAVSDKKLTQTDLVKMTINTGDSAPVKLKTRPVPLGMRQKLKELLQDLLDRNITEKSNSDWAFPIVLVEKKDGSIRLHVDYRELNKRIKLDAYPLPSIEAVLQSLGGKRFFSTLDLCSGYWQIPLAEDAKEKSAFTTPEGLFQFRVTPFGLSTSPPVFQRLMDRVLGDLLGKRFSAI